MIYLCFDNQNDNAGGILEKYSKYFNEIVVFKNKFEIIEEISLEFNEELTSYKIKKILDFFLTEGIIQEITYRHKKFFISNKFLKEKGVSVKEYFGQINLDILNSNMVLQKNVYHLSEEAIVEKKLSDLFK